MSVPLRPRPDASPHDDPEVVALENRWKRAIEDCQDDLREGELKAIRDFQGPQQLDADIRKRLEESAQGKLKNLVSQISPFFDTLQQALLLFTAVMPAKSLPLTLVAGGAYLAVKKCAEFESASTRIVDILDKIKQQLMLFKKYSENLALQSSCRDGLVRMFIALIKFWVHTLRFLGRNPRDNNALTDNWYVLNQNFLRSLQQIEEAVKDIQQLQDIERNHPETRTAKAHSEVVEAMPNVDISEAAFPCHEIQALDKNFRGRSEELELALKILGGGYQATPHTIVISGLAGVGKTAVAVAAAHRCKAAKFYDAILWLNAQDRDVLRESFTRIALRLQLRGANESSDKDHNFMLVTNWLDKTARSWLLIYDNVDDATLLEAYYPPDTGSMIITTRFQSVSYSLKRNTTRISLETLSSKDSLELFNSLRLLRHPQADIASEEIQTKKLLEEMDGLALGIKQMAYYISSKKMTISSFQDKYTRMAQYIFKHKTPSASHTLSTLWSVQFKSIQGNNSSKLLGLLSLCGPDNIPRDLFELAELLQNTTGEWAAFLEDEAEVEEAIDNLRDNALIESEEGNAVISIHRLTQKAFIHNTYGLYEIQELLNTFNCLIALLNQHFPDYGREKSLLDEWSICARFIPHVAALARNFKEFSTPKTPARSLHSDESFALLLKKATWYLQEIGELRECSSLLEIATASCQDKNSLTYAYLYNTYVAVAVDMNHMTWGHEFSEKAISIREAQLAPDDLDLAVSYNNYANALLNEGRFDDCLAKHALSDHIWTSCGKDSGVYRGLTHLNVGRAYSLKGDASQAVSYFRKAEDIFSGLPNKTFLMGVHYTWGTLSMNQGYLLQALRMFEISHDLAKETTPFQLVMSAIHYKLAVLGMKLGIAAASIKTHLQQARTIAEYHQRDAETARIGRHLAPLIAGDPQATEEDRLDAEELAAKAKAIKGRLWTDISKRIPEAARSEEEEYDWLVAAWYR